MDNFNLDELMDLAEAYVGPMVDAIYRRLIERDFALEDPEVVMLLTALINILVHDNRGDRPTEVLLMAAYGEREVLDKLDECEGRLSELLIDSATDESEVNSPIKMTPQDNEGEVVYLSRTRRGTMRSKMVIDKINAMKMKLGSRVMPRRIGKTKMDSEISMKAGNSAKRKRVEEVTDLGQGDYQLSGTDRIITDIAMVPPILMAGIKSTGYKSKRSDRTLTGATLEMEILSQCGESKMRDFKPSPMNHGKGSVAGQLTPVEYNRLTVSETVSIDEPTGGYMEMLEYRNSARGHVMALEEEKAMEGYLETMLQGTILKQKAYGTLASSDVQAETIEQLVSLPWKAVVLRYFEEEMRTTPRIHALVAVPYEGQSYNSGSPGA